MPWVGTIVHSGPFGQASPGIKSALPTIGKSIVRYLHAHTDTYVRSTPKLPRKATCTKEQFFQATQSAQPSKK